MMGRMQALRDATDMVYAAMLKGSSIVTGICSPTPAVNVARFITEAIADGYDVEFVSRAFARRQFRRNAPRPAAEDERLPTVYCANDLHARCSFAAACGCSCHQLPLLQLAEDHT